MKILKLFTAAIAVTGVGLLAVPSLAQGPGGGRFGGGQRPDMVARLSDELHLTPAQQNKIHAIMNEYRPKMEAMRGNPNAREQMRPMMQEIHAKIAAVLTPAQKKKFEAMGPMMGGGPGGRMMRDLDQLGLTPGQRKKIDAIMADMRAKMQAIPEDQRRQQGRALMESYRGKIEGVMSKAQKAKFEAMMQQGRGGGPGGGPRG